MGKQINSDVDHSTDLGQNDLNLPLDEDISSASKQTPEDPHSPLNSENPAEIDNKRADDGEEEEPEGQDNEADPVVAAGDQVVDPDDEEDSFQELPSDQVNKLNVKERAFYRDLKKEREKRQKIEVERDFLLFQKKYGPSADKQKVNEEDEEHQDEWQDPFSGKDPDDVVTLKELQERERSKQAFEERKAGKERERQRKQKDAQAARDAENSQKIEALESKFRRTHPDYDEALKLAGEVIKKRPSLAFAVRAEMDDPDGDPVSAVYELAKQHPDYAKIRGKKDTKDNVNRIVRNASRPRTIANMNEQGGAADDLEGMDSEELGKTLAGFSESQLSKVPRKLREKALRGY